MKTGALVAIIVIVLLVIGGIYYSSSRVATPVSGNEQQQEKAPTGIDVPVEIKDFAFSPSELTVNIGDRVIWTNNDAAPHKIVATNDEFISENIENGETYSFVFAKAGTYKYYCGLHPSMKGTIIVR
ncbi:MAG: cupredoxin family copper-binding protein [archaeon]|nr:cupredoxin family copper-binding protein [archaeon]